jgi:hypothetical protein
MKNNLPAQHNGFGVATGFRGACSMSLFVTISRFTFHVSRCVSRASQRKEPIYG